MYGKDFAWTRAIINEARLLARQAVFGNANENAKYIFALFEELELTGQFVRLNFATREEALNKCMLVVLAKEGQRRETAGKRNSIGREEAKAYLTKWRRDNLKFISSDTLELLPRIGDLSTNFSLLLLHHV